MKLTIKGLFIGLTLLASNVYAYQLSDLNGRWYNDRFGITFTLSGLPKGKVKPEKAYVASYRAQGRGVDIVGYCDIAQLKSNYFESHCYSTANDHTYIRFIDKDTMEEDDLVYGFGKVTSSRLN